MKSKTKLIITIVAILLAVVAIGFIISSVLMGAKQRSWGWLEEQLEAGTVISIDVNNYVATIEIKNDSKQYRVNVRWAELYEQIQSLDEDIRPDYSVNNPNSGAIWNYILTGVITLSVIIFAIMLFRNMGAGGRKAMDFSRSGAQAHSSVRVRFNDVAGAEEEKEELKEIVEFLKSPQKFTAAGAKIPRGVLLVGPPGTGKTLFAKAVAGEANVPFFSISGSDFVEMYVGVGASRVRDLFDVARRNKPCIIFIDEIDAVGRQRGAGLGGGHDEREQTLNQLLVQMDGFDTGDDIIVMAATNRADVLDPALLRPGRFDRQIYVNYPDVRGREAIFKVHSRNKQIDAGIDFQQLARITSGFTGADIANILNEAAILAARDGRVVINMQDIYESINKVSMGPQKKSRLVTEHDKRITAYHEAGHAIVAKVVPQGVTVHEVSIIPRGNAGGYTAFRPENDNSFTTKGDLEAMITRAMGGRAAEEIIIKDITTGASMDIKQATSVARRMVTEWGMSGIGPIFYGGEREVFLGRDYGSAHEYSDEIAAKIDKEVENIIAAGHKRAVDILTEGRSKMEVMARVLIECETIYSDEVDLIMEGKSAAEVLEVVKSKRKTNSQTQTQAAQTQTANEDKTLNNEDKTQNGD